MVWVSRLKEVQKGKKNVAQDVNLMFENIREESQGDIAQHLEHMLENIHDKSHSFVVSPSENVSDDNVPLYVLGKKKSKNTLKTLLPYVHLSIRLMYLKVTSLVLLNL